MTDVVLSVRDLKKSFGGIQALKGVDFELRRGEIHALCGENGAGKSTLVRIIGGLSSPDSGEISISGSPMRFGQRTDPRLVSIVHQELSIIPHLSVLDNVLIGDARVGEFYFRSRYRADVRRRLDEIGLGNVSLDEHAGKLSIAEQQLLEICRAVMRGAKILILDEPTASLSDGEIKRVFETVRWLSGNGTAVIYISHRLPEIFSLTHSTTVFRNGRRVMTKPTAEWTNEELVTEMIGRAVEPAHSVRAPDAGSKLADVISLKGLHLPGRLGPVDFAVKAGEIVGVVGQLGSGANALIETLAGLEKHYGGEIRIGGELHELRSLAKSIDGGIAYVSEDRGGKSLFLGAPVEVNLTAAILDRIQRGGILRFAAADKIARQLASTFQIDAKRLPGAVSDLSGGNQQKVAIAKSVALEPRILLLNEPTRGVDVGARTEIYRELKGLAEAGTAIVFFSTDLEEIRELSHRVVTIFKGTIVNDLPVENTTMDSILADVLRGSEDARAAA